MTDDIKAGSNHILIQRIFYLTFVGINFSSNLFDQNSISIIFLILVNWLYLITLISDIGSFFKNKLETNDFVEILFVGLICFTLLTSILCFLGVPAKWMFLTIVSGHLIFRIIKPLREKLSFLQVIEEAKQIPWSLNILCILLVASCLIPRTYHDALNYHLLGPWLWFNNSPLSTLEKFIPAFHCGYFEQLYMWGLIFFKSSFA